MTKERTVSLPVETFGKTRIERASLNRSRVLTRSGRPAGRAPGSEEKVTLGWMFSVPERNRYVSLKPSAYRSALFFNQSLRGANARS